MIPNTIPQDWADNEEYYARLASAPPRTPRPFLSAAGDALAYDHTDDDPARRVPWAIAAVGIVGLAAASYVVWLVIVAFARAAAGVG